MLTITALYAALLALIGIVLASGSGLLRAKTGVSLGPGEDPRQLVAFRRHGNFAEWVPLTVVLIAILELNGVTGTAIHALGATLVVARIAHPLGLKADDMSGAGRLIGAALTMLVTLVSAIWCLVTAF